MRTVYLEPYITQPNSRDIDTIQVYGYDDEGDTTVKVNPPVKCFKKCPGGWKEITIEELCERTGAKG